MLLSCRVGGSWESLGLKIDPTGTSKRRSVLSVHWKDWFWSSNSNTLATWCTELTHLKRPWCWERLKAGGEGDDKGWEGWIASLTQWTWVWVNSRSWWWTGKPGMLQFMGSQRVRHDWVTELTEADFKKVKCKIWNLGKKITFLWAQSEKSYMKLHKKYKLKNQSITKKLHYKENLYSKNTNNNQDEERILTKKSGHMCVCNWFSYTSETNTTL